MEQWRLGFRQQVKSYQCVFRFKPPKNAGGPASEMTRVEFIQKTSTWIDSLKATTIRAEDKSDDKEIVHLLTFSEGSVRVSFGRDKDGEYGNEQRENEWYTGLVIDTDNLEVIDRIVKEVDRPYWVYKINLKDKLNAANIKSIIQEKTGQEPTGWSIGSTNGIIDGRSFNYTFDNFNDATVRLTLKDEGQIEIVIDGSYDDGFYLAHKLLTYNVVLYSLYGAFTQSKKHQLIKDACAKPSN